MFFKESVSKFNKWVSVVNAIPDHAGIFSRRRSRNDGEDNVYMFFKQEDYQLSYLLFGFLFFCVPLGGISGCFLMANVFYFTECQGSTIPVMTCTSNAESLHNLFFLGIIPVLIAGSTWCFIFINRCHVLLARKVTEDQYQWCLKVYERLGLDAPSRDMDKIALIGYVKAAQKQVEEAISPVIDHHISLYVNGN